MPIPRAQYLQQLIAQAQNLIVSCEQELSDNPSDQVSLSHTIEDAREQIESYQEELAELDFDQPSDRVVHLNDENFNQEVMGSELPVLVDFWATWCGPCQQLTPLVAQLSREFEGKVKFGKLDVDEATGVASQLDVQSLPTLMIFSNRRVVDLLRGVPSLAQLRTRLERILES